MNIVLEPGAFEPIRAHKSDAGLDIRAMEDGLVRAGRAATFRTGVHVELPQFPHQERTAGILLPKSGLMCNHNILTFGVIDESYRGEIMVHMFNLGADDYMVHAGDKISQLVITRVLCEPITIVDALSDGERGEAGFGSSGR